MDVGSRDELATPVRSPGAFSRTAALACVAFAVATLFARLGSPGLLAPSELGAAERARTLHGTGATTTLADLGSGELAWDLVHGSLRAFGASATSARLPMAVLGASGVLACAWALFRGFGPRAAATVAALLVVTPAYFVASRHLLGDVASLASLAWVVCGATVSVAANSPRGRTGGMVLGAMGIAAGAFARGALFGVALPLAIVAIAMPKRTGRARAFAGFLGVVSCATTLAFAFHAARSAPGAVDAFLGVRVHDPAHTPFVFDRVTTDLFRSSFPLGAFAFPALPFLAATPSGATTVGVGGVTTDASTFLRRSALWGSALAVGTATIASTVSDVHAFGVPVLLAIAATIALERLARAEGTFVAFGILVAGLAALHFRDGRDAPTTTAAALGIAPALAASMPTHGAALAWGLASGATFAAGLVLATVVPGRIRGTLVMVALVTAGTILRFGIHPRWVEHFSPADSLAEVAHVRDAGEPLATVRLADVRADFVGTSIDTRFDRVDTAAKWLEEGPGRRWLAFSEDDLAELNASHRRRTRENLAVPFGAGSRVLVATNDLPRGLGNANPLRRVVLDVAPTPTHRLRAEIGDGADDRHPEDGARLVVLGWDLVDDDGVPRGHVARRGTTHLRLFYEVLRGGLTGACSFVHLEGTPHRIALDHPDLGAYPMRLWRTGDFIVDDFEITVPSSFVSGVVPLRFGFGVLPCTDDRRKPILRGPDDGSGRVVAGTVVVR
ncbi:MAG: hypothetical protein U0169_03915 [Polyangiaceae bacterium]